VVCADRILVLEDGRLRAAGRHDELLATDELYRELAATQLLDSVSCAGDDGVGPALRPMRP
jgi:ATP-binding cassette subfamily B protein